MVTGRFVIPTGIVSCQLETVKTNSIMPAGNMITYVAGWHFFCRFYCIIASWQHSVSCQLSGKSAENY